MAVGSTYRAVAMVVGLVAIPGVASAQPLNPTAVADAPPVVQAVGSFVLVGLCGGLVLARRGHLVDRAVDDTMASPVIAVLYGLGAYVFVLFAGLLASTLLAQFGVARTPVGALSAVVLVGGVALLGGFGYVVVGTVLTDLFDERRPRRGLLLGSALSAVCWLVLPVLAAVAVWLLVAAVGVGGRARTWVHAERTVPAERATSE